MSTPQAKRRRLNEAAKTLQKPFKSPFRTLSKPSIGDDPPFSDPPETESSTKGRSADNSVCTSSAHSTSSAEQKATTTSASGNVAPAQRPSASRIPKTLVSRPNPSTPSRLASRSTLSKPSTAREIMQLRNEIQMLTQAQTLATSSKDDDLVALIEKWRTASRAAAEELFGITRDRVNRMGGVGAWQEREKEAKQRQMKWDQEEIEAERVRVREARENGEIPQEEYDRFAEMEGDREIEEEKETFKNTDDSFTMDMMLKTLNIDLQLIGYNKEAQRWDG
ncbi:hypothetical protein GGP41_008484 [Bipolaris sorokiniana]|uniref:Swi5-dependent recombination DNA repair protein 1 n=2 Tax=Cochliobolus sativus TaxID=45130 RepID=A0A8H5ZD14_COCSA|nr:uncharacterized protein COCSADRAFT_164616 [Bipolaris sorokiniana ND90Pr]EMD59744.1 hypothetical protein COCSADRAFT_164616 [Bipolaris sorokiniana ND90Pr]KAF5845989.1 hypothetical protein GGP41_008484 [Bipolaris sorokiniana]